MPSLLYVARMYDARMLPVLRLPRPPPPLFVHWFSCHMQPMVAVEQVLRVDSEGDPCERPHGSGLGCARPPLVCQKQDAEEVRRRREQRERERLPPWRRSAS